MCDCQHCAGKPTHSEAHRLRCLARYIVRLPTLEQRKQLTKGASPELLEMVTEEWPHRNRKAT